MRNDTERERERRAMDKGRLTRINRVKEREKKKNGNESAPLYNELTIWASSSREEIRRARLKNL